MVGQLEVETPVSYELNHIPSDSESTVSNVCHFELENESSSSSSSEEDPLYVPNDISDSQLNNESHTVFFDDTTSSSYAKSEAAESDGYCESTIKRIAKERLKRRPIKFTSHCTHEDEHLSEEERLRKKKEQNKLAAVRYRVKKRIENEYIRKMERELLEKNKILMNKYRDLTLEAKYIKVLLRKMFPDSPSPTN